MFKYWHGPVFHDIKNTRRDFFKKTWPKPEIPANDGKSTLVSD